MRKPRRTFVRGLWGVSQDGVESPNLREKVWRDISLTVRRYRSIEPVINYVYGRDNAAVLESLGVPYTLLSEDPLVNFTGSIGRPRDCSEGPQAGRLAWGISITRHKLECIRLALETHDEVVWLDWDTHYIAPRRLNHRRFWSELSKGQPFQASIFSYRNPQARWRDFEKGMIPHGAFMYFRDRRIVERAIELHPQFAAWSEEVPLAKVVEEMMGGKWLGVDEYYRRGFAPFCSFSYGSARLPREALFTEGMRRIERQIRRIWPHPGPWTPYNRTPPELRTWPQTYENPIAP